MRKRCSFLMAISILLLLMIPSIGMADIDEEVMTVGDTFIYSVKQFDVPWKDLFGDGDQSYPWDKLVLDLSGSTLAVKVMALDTFDGLYVLNSYVILGEAIHIPFPANTPEEVTDIFGDKIIIPDGVGIGIGQYIPGSDYLNIDGGLPFYLDPTEWNTYKDLFEDLPVGNIDVNVTNEGDEFIVEFQGETGSGAQINTETTTTTTEESSEATTTEVVIVEGPNLGLDIEVVWHREGKHAGIFKRVSGNVKIIGD
ncbi:MAG: hypothetical protein ACFFDT_13245, partial [Candidatus Hodarchaeota archaeon]